MSAQLLPELSVRDGRAALAFYARALGAEVVYQVGGVDGHEEVVAQLAIDGVGFWVSDASPAHGHHTPDALGGTTVRLLLVVDDPAALVERAVGAGAALAAPVVEEHGWLLGRIVDPFGHVWEIGRPLGAWPPGA